MSRSARHTIATVSRQTGHRRSDMVLAACMMVCLATVVIGLIGAAGLPENDPNPYDTFQYAFGFSAVAVGGYVALRAPAHPMGWLLLFAGWGDWLAASGYAVLSRGWLMNEIAARTAYAFGTAGWVWGRGVVFVLVPMMYAAGDAFSRTAPVYRRVLWWLAVVVIANACLFQIMNHVPIDFATGLLPSWTEPFQRWYPGAMRAIWVVSVVATLDLLFRVLRMDGPEARRHRTIAFGAIVLMLPPLIELAAQVGFGDGLNLDWVEFAAVTLLLILLSYGILRHGVLGFRTALRRTALYSGVTVVAAGLYIAIVAMFAAVLQDGVGRGPVVATGVVAVSFQPVRAGVQRFLDRWVFGDRDEPYRALAGLGRRLGDPSPDNDPLAVVAEAVRASLRVPAVSIEVMSNGEAPSIAATAATDRPGGAIERVRIMYEGTLVGSLLVTLPPGERLVEEDRRLLDDLAGAAGAVVRSASLATDLARSRDSIVRAREEERRRLRHDLHDGLGPTLASVAMGLDAAADRLTDDPELRELLLDLDKALQDGIDDIRRLVYGLRPPALDELGLLVALQHQARDMSIRSRRPDGTLALVIDVEVDGALPELGAAVEVAAFRIAVEAMTNVLRHAKATHCTVRLSADESLTVVVEDDGIGIESDRPAGVGLESMSNRAAELAGRLACGSREHGGTRLVAVLPLHDRVPT